MIIQDLLSLMPALNTYYFYNSTPLFFSLKPSFIVALIHHSHYIS